MRFDRRRHCASLFALTVVSGCASAPRLPSPAVLAAAQGAQTYSAELSVSLRGGELRGRGRVLVAFARPDALRVEVPGPGGARLVAVARAGQLVAVFPSERGIYTAPASSEEMEALLGIALTPREVGDLLLGLPGPRLTRCRVEWGLTAPRRVKATLPDGAQIDLKVREPLLDGALGPAVFEPPAAAGYRALDREEARSLWTRR